MVFLREDFTPSGGAHKVDRENGIIFDVKFVGRSSSNRPFQTKADGTLVYEDVDGTDYTLEALQDALPLYAEEWVHIDHPPRDKVGADRTCESRFGKPEGLRVTEDGLRGNLRYLKSHPMAERVCEAAERFEGAAFAISHNAAGDGRIENRRYVVTKIPSVRGLDLVTHGGTNRSLFESRTPLMSEPKKLSDVFAKSKSPQAAVALKLLLEDGEYADMAAAGPEEAGDWKADLLAAVGKLIDSTDEADHKKVDAIIKMLKPAKEKVEESDQTAVASADDGDKKDSVDQVKESAQLRNENKALHELMEAGVAKPPKSLIRALCALDDAGRRELIESYKTLPAKPAGDKVRSKAQSAGNPDAQAELMESRGIPKEAKGQLAYLRN